MNPNDTTNNSNIPPSNNQTNGQGSNHGNNQGSNKGKKKGPLPPRWGWINTVSAGLVILFILVSIYSAISQNSTPGTSISLTQLANNIASSSAVSSPLATSISSSTASSTIVSIVVKGSEVDATYRDGSVKTTQLEDNSSLTQTLGAYGITSAQLKSISINVEQPSGFLFWFEELAPTLGSILFVILFLWFMTRQMRGAGMQVFSFGQSKARITMPDDVKEKVTFKDVAGAKEAKQELSEVVDFLKNPKKFLDIGARIPKGILLMGAPGTGKTLLARAVAGEAGVAFFSISGSEFVEMFVGVGASRVRDLFKMAKQSSSAIIFVDEIDAVGRVRGGGVGGGNDEREQTLNQILVEMDGFEPNEKIVVMAATNRPDVLDPALLRPGRFDRRVIIDLPDRNDREEILKIHSRKKPFAEDVNLRVVAERTPGFSGADLYSLMNEGAILAARENRTKVSQYDLIRSIEKVMMGPERKSHILSKKEKEITAYHEAGHALVGSVLEHSDPVHKISIIARGRAGGYTLHLPFEDRKLQSKKEFLDLITMSLGGYVTERMIFGDVTTGPSNDLQVSTALARDMVTRYGMSDKLGAMAFETSESRAIFGEGLERSEFSEKVAGEIDAEVSHIMSESLGRAETAVKTHRPLLDAIAKRLIEKETIEHEEFESILVAHGIQPKKSEAVV